MPRSKVAISLEENTLRRLDLLVKQEVFPNRSQAIQTAVEEKLERLDRSRLARSTATHRPQVHDEVLAAWNSESVDLMALGLANAT